MYLTDDMEDSFMAKLIHMCSKEKKIQLMSQQRANTAIVDLGFSSIG